MEFIVSFQCICYVANAHPPIGLLGLIRLPSNVTYCAKSSPLSLRHQLDGGIACMPPAINRVYMPRKKLDTSVLEAGNPAETGSSYPRWLPHRLRGEFVASSVAARNGDSDKGNANKNSDDYLDDRVSFSEDKIMDAESKAVMMAWEKPLMEAHAKAVCSNGGHVLNVGFGMGLVDTAIQQYAPASHTIIEAHPEVYDRMIRQGWNKKDNVKIIFGRWQDVVSQLESYDGIFFDTYGEYYEDMREFHQYLPKLLKPGGIYSFFNGLCGGNPFFHVVYCQLVSLELSSMGYSTQLIPLPVKDCLSEEIWEGVKHKYWQLDTYYLPVCHSTNESD
nr:protein arginine N-methyltransferase 2 [Ipomoea batatas]